MPINREKLNNTAITLAISLMGAILITVLYLNDNFEDLENKILDSMLIFKREGLFVSKENVNIRQDKFIEQDIVIIGIETQDLQKIGKWPWPRKNHAKLIDNLNKQNKPKLIYFDMFFSEPDYEHPEYDQALADACERAGNVYFNYYFLQNTIGTKDENVNSKPLLDKFTLTGKYIGPDKYPEMLPGVTKIYEKSKGIGFINTDPEPDGKYRYLPLIIYYKNKIYPSVTLLIAMEYLNTKKENVVISTWNNIHFKNYKIPIDSSSRMLINYVGGRQTFQYFSYSEIINNEVQFDWKNKIVLVGFTSTLGLMDIKSTPFGSMPGVEIIANAVNQILLQDHIKALTSIENIIIILILGISIGIIAVFFKHFKWLIFSVGIAISYTMFAFYQFDYNNKLMKVTQNITVIVLNFIMIAVYHYILKEREEKKVRAIFSSYVTPALAEEILKNPEKAGLHGETREMTVLFSDIRNFTTFSEKRTPREVVNMLNEYLTAMTNVVLKYNGILDKYVGDEIMAFWGAPILQPNHAELAVKCGIEMLHVLTELQNKWKSEGKEPIGIGIGINSGEMIVGNIGTAGKKMDYTVIGDNVNLGARVEALTRKYDYDLIVTEFTYQHTKDIIQAKELDTVTVKGKKLPVKIYGISV